jgi:sec-independent protein translocase protein TatC
MLFKILQKLFRLREKSREQRDENGDVVKPFLDHMEDLRWTLIKCAIVLVVTMSVAFWKRQELMRLLENPVHRASEIVGETIRLRSDNIIDPFMISLKMAFYVGLVFALPIILYFIADFILPALTKKEKRLLAPTFSVGLVLFLAGAAASYFFLMPHMLVFFFNDAKKLGIEAFWTWSNYSKVFTWLTIGFGLMCELPLVILVLASLGIVSHKFLVSTRSYATVIIMVLAMLVAPTPDPFTFLALSAPILLMYEACIWIVWLLEARARKRARARDIDDLVK